MRFRQLEEAFAAFRRDHASRFGAALAFYIVLSIAPVAVIAIGVAARIFGRHAAEGVIFRQIVNTLGPVTASAVEEMVKNAAAPRAGFIATALSLATVAFGLIGIYTQIEDALTTIWREARTEVVPATMPARLRTFALVVAVVCLLLIIVCADAAIAITGKYAGHHLIGGEPLWQAVQLTVSVTVLAIVFASVFRQIPVTKVPWRDALPGAALTAAFFVIGKFALGLYLGKAAVGSSYGAAGSLVVVLLWAYWSAQIFFFGLELTHVYAARDPAVRSTRKPVQNRTVTMAGSAP